MRISNNNVRFSFFTIVMVMLLSVLSSHGAFSSVKLHGRQYISVNSIKNAYQFTDLKISGSSVSLSKKGVRLDLKTNSSYVNFNTLKFIFSYPVVKSGSTVYVSETDTLKVIDPIMRPSSVTKGKNLRTVIIDPGHGGKDAGAVNTYGTEAGYNLIVAKLVKAQLLKAGYKVIMTRETDVFLTLPQRVALANRYQDAIFVSIHFNAAKNRSAKGIETFTLSPVGVAHYGRNVKSSDYKTRQGNSQDSANIALASAIHSRMITRTKAANVLDRGIKRARFSVLTSIKHPAVLVEAGFLSNASEAKWIHKPIYQRTVATAISEGVTKYRKATLSR